MRKCDVYDYHVVVWPYSKFHFRNILEDLSKAARIVKTILPRLFFVDWYDTLDYCIKNDKTYIHTVLSYFVMWFCYPFVVMAYLNEVVRFNALTWLSTQTKHHNTILGTWRKLKHMNKMNDFENCDLQNRFDIKFAVYRIMLWFNALDNCVK